MGNAVHLSAIRCFPFLFLKHSPSYRQRKRSLDFARDDDTGNAPFPTNSLYDARDSHPPRCHFKQREIFFVPFSLTSSLSRLREAPPPPFRDTVFPVPRCQTLSVLPSTKRSLDFARDDDTRNAPFPLPMIRCFPFLAVRRSPSYRQRKRSFGSASDDDTGNVLFSHILCMMHGIAIPHAVISSAARNLFHPLFPASFAKPFTGNTVRLSAIRCFPFLAVRRSPSYRQRKRSLGSASDNDTRNVLFPHILCMMHGIAIPHAVISSVARNLFRPLFP